MSRSEAMRSAVSVFLFTRIAVFAVAYLAALAQAVTPAKGPGGFFRARYDAPELTQAFGGTLSPLARWDAVHYLSIADEGYVGGDHRMAFFPLYPFASRAVAEILGGSPGAILVSAYLISLAAFLASLYFLHRLVTLEVGREFAAPTLLILAVFPAAVFFGAPYAESLFLLASVGAFYAARIGNWPWAGAACAAAAATRPAGVLVLLPLAVLYLWGPRADRPAAFPAAGGRLGRLRPRYRLRPDAAWLLLGPLGVGAFALYLGLAHGDPLGFLGAQERFGRELVGPLTGIEAGIAAVIAAAGKFLSGAPFPPWQLINFAVFVLGVVGVAGVARRLPAAYGIYAAASLVVLVSYSGGEALQSLPRQAAVIFPLFMWLALVCVERGVTDRVAAASAVMLGLFTTWYATWQWVS